MSTLGFALAGGALGTIGGIGAQREAARQADRMREYEALGALRSYKWMESAVNLNKALAVENSINMTEEVLRAGAEQGRQVKSQAQKATSSVAASQEGLASGNSKGRTITDTIMKGNKAVHQSNKQTMSMINQLSEAKDKQMNMLNQQQLQAYNQMAMILTTPGQTVYEGSTWKTIGSGLNMAGSFAGLGTLIK